MKHGNVKGAGRALCAASLSLILGACGAANQAASGQAGSKDSAGSSTTQAALRVIAWVIPPTASGALTDGALFYQVVYSDGTLSAPISLGRYSNVVPVTGAPTGEPAPLFATSLGGQSTVFRFSGSTLRYEKSVDYAHSPLTVGFSGATVLGAPIGTSSLLSYANGTQVAPPMTLPLVPVDASARATTSGFLSKSGTGEVSGLTTDSQGDIYMTISAGSGALVAKFADGKLAASASLSGYTAASGALLDGDNLYVLGWKWTQPDSYSYRLLKLNVADLSVLESQDTGVLPTGTNTLTLAEGGLGPVIYVASSATSSHVAGRLLELENGVLRDVAVLPPDPGLYSLPEPGNRICLFGGSAGATVRCVSLPGGQVATAVEPLAPSGAYLAAAWTSS